MEALFQYDICNILCNDSVALASAVAKVASEHISEIVFAIAFLKLILEYLFIVNEYNPIFSFK